MDDLSVAFEKLRTSTQRLNAISDDAAQRIREVEAYLDELHVGVTASVNLRTEWVGDEQDSRSIDHDLCYMRHHSGKFRICISVTPEWADSDDDVSVRAWSECSRDEKLSSFEKLPALLVEIAKKVDERVERAEKAVAEVTAKLPLPKKRKGGEK